MCGILNISLTLLYVIISPNQATLPLGRGGTLELALAGFGIGFVGSRSLDLCREESHGGLAGRYFWNDAPAVGSVGWGVFMVGFFVFFPCNLVVFAGKGEKGEIDGSHVLEWAEMFCKN